MTLLSVVRFVFLLIGMVSPIVNGWCTEGHEATGMTAMSVVKTKALAQLKRLMGGQDAVDVAGWADKVSSKYPDTTEFHFMNQPRPANLSESVTALPNTTCENNRCLIGALNHFYGRVTSQKLSDLEYPHSLQFTDADAIKFLVNLICDLHQPMHLGFNDDNSGRDVIVHYKLGDQDLNTTLFDYFDTDLIKKFMKLRANFWYGGWTHVNTIGKAFYLKEKEEWDNTPLESRHTIFLKWGLESYDMVRQSIYSSPVTHEPLSSPIHVDNRMEFSWFEDVKKRILRGGVRTGIVLNSLLDQREASRLRQGSGVQLPAEEGHLTSPMGLPLWVQHLSYNLGILVVILALFVYITKFYGGPPNAPKAAETAATLRPMKEWMEDSQFKMR